jgi:hypothetical protein
MITSSNSKKKIKKPPVLFQQTQEILAGIQEKLDMQILTYWNSHNGSVCYNDVNAMYEILKKIGKQERLALFIKSGGGNGQASLRIINLLRQYCPEIIALVPVECASAATMIAIGADTIQMGPLAYLTAVDTSLRHQLSPRDKENRSVSVSLDGVNRVIQLWGKEAHANHTNPYEALFPYIHPLVIGAIDRSESLSIKICREIMSYHIEDAEKINEISTQLNANYPSHGYPITLREARKIGLPAHEMDDGVNTLLLELNKVYTEMGQQAVTDYDEFNYHNHAILNIIEGNEIQVIFQTDEDWHYIKEEQRWSSTNDASAWHVTQTLNGKVVKSVLHIS